MNQLLRNRHMPFGLSRVLAAALLSLSGALLAAAGAGETEVGLPSWKFQALPDRVVGLFVPDASTTTALEGRRGPANALAFASGPGSYRWVYIPNQKKPAIGGLLVSVGEDGKNKQRFDRLSLASPSNLQPFGVTDGFALVELEVNAGRGAPPGESFVATAVRPVEGTAKYPLRVAPIIGRLQQHFKGQAVPQTKSLEQALHDLRLQLGWDAGPASARRQHEFIHATWLDDQGILKVQIRTRIEESDPLPNARIPAAALAGDDGLPPAREVRRTVGVESGMVYEVTRHGELARMEPLAIERFHKASMTAVAKRLTAEGKK
jgi:hypothetical protein